MVERANRELDRAGQVVAFRLVELLVTEDGDVLIVVDFVVGQLAGGRLDVFDDVDGRLGGTVGIGIVVEYRIGSALMLPALEDIPDSVGDRLPRMVGPVDGFEEGEAVFGLFSAACRKSSRCGREGAELWIGGATIYAVCERGIWDDNVVVVYDRAVKGFNATSPAYWHEDEIGYNLDKSTGVSCGQSSLQVDLQEL